MAPRAVTAHAMRISSSGIGLDSACCCVFRAHPAVDPRLAGMGNEDQFLPLRR